MYRHRLLAVAALVTASCGRELPPEGFGQRPPPPPPWGRSPLFRVIDVDRNHELSPDEIEGAALAIKQLDRNQDGTLTPHEIRPHGLLGRGRPMSQHEKPPQNPNHAQRSQPKQQASE